MASADCAYSCSRAWRSVRFTPSLSLIAVRLHLQHAAHSIDGSESGANGLMLDFLVFGLLPPEVSHKGSAVMERTERLRLRPIAGFKAGPLKRYVLQTALQADHPKELVLRVRREAPDFATEVKTREAEVRIPLRPSRSAVRRRWERIRIQPRGYQADEHFMAYRIITSAGRDTHQTILICGTPPLCDFMAYLPDDTALGDLCLPGTHESCALYGFPISQCQQPATPIAQQLLDGAQVHSWYRADSSGVRWFDIRLRAVGDELLMYHGPQSQRSSIVILLETLHSFLDSHSGETVIVSFKQESPPVHAHFSSVLYRAIQPYISTYWFIEERIPTLGEVRGKAILLSRFDRDLPGLDNDGGGWPDGLGINPDWPDSRREGFEWDCAGTEMRVQDWYRINSFIQIPEKFELLKRHLEPTLLPDPCRFTLSFSTASSFPLGFPTTIAKGFGYPAWGLGVEGMNARLTRWLLELIAEGRRLRAVVPMDFYRQEGWPGEMLVLMNFLGEPAPDVEGKRTFIDGRAPSSA